MTDLFQKQRKKLEKKHNRLIKSIFQYDKIELAGDPTEKLIVANGGLGNNVSQEDLAGIFSAYGSLTEISLLPDKSYAFVVFSSTYEAIQAKQHVDGLKTHINNGVVFYVLFVNQIVRSSLPSVVPPNGLVVIENFISEDEEVALLDSISWSEGVTEGAMKHRRVKHFGFEFQYTINNINKDEPLSDPLPESCDELLKRMLGQGHISVLPDQLTVNQYQPGQGIPSHIDTHSACDDTIISLSLGSQVVMDFKDPSGNKSSVLLPQRSVLIMSGEARYKWQHGIVPRKSDVLPSSTDNAALTLEHRRIRTSFTFRKVIREPCTCDFKEQCDSQQSRSQDNVPLPITGADAAEMEHNHVHEVYDQIASNFSETRYNRWPRVAAFLNQLEPGSVVADVGCGNGKYLGTRSDICMLGCDRSIGLCEICAQLGHHIYQCDCLHVPLRSESCDACISIAVIHHLSLKERRLDAISEMLRILRPGGEALIYVWAMEQERDGVKSNYLKTTENSPKDDEPLVEDSNPGSSHLPIHVNRTQFKAQDMLVPWHLKAQHSTTNQEQVHYRYYHIFESEELKDLMKEFDNVDVKDYYYDRGNWCIIIKKIQ